MWYEVRQTAFDQDNGEGVFNSVESAIDCVLQQFDDADTMKIIGYDLLDGIPNKVWWAGFLFLVIDQIDDYDKEYINDFDVAYTLGDNEVLIVQFDTALLAEKAKGLE